MSAEGQLKMEKLPKEPELEKAQVYIDFVKDNLEPLAQHLKVSVEWLWNILVMQARVEAIVYLVVVASAFVTTAVLTRVFFKNIEKAEFHDGLTTYYRDRKTGEVFKNAYDTPKSLTEYQRFTPKSNRQAVLCWVSGPLAVILLVTGVVTASSSMTTIVTGLVNPEFRAIEKIAEFAKPQVEKASE